MKMPHEITTNVRMYYNENLNSVYMFVPGTMAMILMLISAMMTSIAITREKEMGTMEILLVSPLRAHPHYCWESHPLFVAVNHQCHSDIANWPFCF